MAKRKKVDPIPRIKKVVEKRATRDSKWEIAFVQYDQTEVYASLCSDLISKCIKHRDFITKIRTQQKEDGSQIVWVWYNTNYRVTYHIDGF